MSTEKRIPESRANESASATGGRKSLGRGKRTLKACGLILLCLLVLPVVLLCGISLFLTPERLARIAEEQAEKYLDADVYVGDVKFSLWSTFPHFHVEVDSLNIISHTFSGLTAAQRDSLPDSPDFLASSGRLSGGINVVSLLAGKYRLSNVTLENLRLNCVALNDSVTNYDIVRSEGPTHINVPEIEAQSLTLVHPRNLSYYSAATDTYADLRFSKAGLTRLGKHGGDYDMTFKGLISVKSDNLEVLRRFPFSFAGKVDIGFKPFSLKFDNYAITLGNISGHMNLDLNMGEDIRVRNFQYTLSAVDLMRLAQYLPSQWLPELEHINADVAVTMDARLLKPYRYSPSKLPSLAVDMRVPDGRVSYDIGDGNVYSVHDLNLDASFIFDGDDPDASYFDISNLSMSGYGTAIALTGKVTDLAGSPRVHADMKAVADMKVFCNEIEELRKYGLSGKLSAETTTDFLMNSLSEPTLSDILLHGTVKIADYAFCPAEGNLRISGDAARIAFRTDAKTPSAIDFANSSVGMDVELSKVRLDHLDGKSLALSGHNLSVQASLNGKDMKEGKPLEAMVKAASLVLHDPADRLNVSLKDADVAGVLLKNQKGYGTSLTLNAKGAQMKAPDTDVKLGALSADFSLQPGAPEKDVESYTLPAFKDTLVLKRLAHTDEYLDFKLPKGLKNFVDNWTYSLALRIASGHVDTPSLKGDNRLTGLRLALDNNRLNIADISLNVNTIPVRINGAVKNLHRIICGDGPTVIPVDLNMALGKVNINKLAYDYSGGTKAPVAETAPRPSDSVALLLPRNLLADVSLSADETIYTNLHLYDLDSKIRIGEGDMNVEYLKVSTDFGKASLGLKYCSSDIERLGADASLDIDSINVVNFFKNFHALLMMMPQMSNLSGYVSAHLTGSVPLFPTMYVNSPGLQASALVSGFGLKVHQTPFIRRITRMLLIPNDNDLIIKNVNIRADVANNMLKLRPFHLEFENYLLSIVGLNNFNGDLYYHLGVDKSPIHLPFGINIKGHFDHPTLRFGGAKYKERNAWAVTDNVQGKYRFNLTAEGRLFMKAFMHKAAQAAVDPNVSL